MAKKNTQVESAPRPDIASIKRTSDVAHADYVFTLMQWAPAELEDIVDPATVAAVDAAISAAGDLFDSTTERAIAKTISTKVEAAVRALTNEDELNGYAGRAFDPEVFAAKVAPKVSKGRARLSPEQKAERVVAEATPEQLEALAELLRAKGIEI